MAMVYARLFVKDRKYPLLCLRLFADEENQIKGV